MDLADTLALLSIEQPARWLQYRDGSWAPVWENGRVGTSFTHTELHAIATAEPLPKPVAPLKDHRQQPDR
ncbi:hypothetical protein GFY24_29750 [Nocardia sp. SYP-A9097]|uniref:hypothetical protein n=1 Tax=Nocardia sp. SYP-A9097 TaxID=2663237 RepID=UPI00129ADF53|nr:hypothetical protein [Nocardia sp. SYP-A9097]MRH91576.1 hypothetical protein [Nocardia sp. SYP-A9097]